MKKFLVVFVFLTSIFGINSQTFKIASLVPANSDFGRALDKINAEWSKATNGKIKMQIIANGAAGDENEVIRKIKLGTFQGGLFSSIGMNRINPLIVNLSAPTLMQNGKQFEYVLEKLTPDLDKSFKEKGWATIAYAPAGWIYLFSKFPIATPADFVGKKIWSSDEDKLLSATYSKMGALPTNASDSQILLSLNSGTIDTMINSPIGTAQKQWFGLANHMLNLPIAPFLGGLMIDAKAWNKISEADQAKLIEIARNIAKTDLAPAINRVEQEAIKVMKDNKLIIIEPDAKAKNAWLEAFGKANSFLLNEGYDKAMIEKIKQLIASFKG